MPEPLTKDEVDSGTEVASAKQADKDTPIEEQIEDFYKTVDGMKAGLMTTIRKDVGPVARSMAIAKVGYTISLRCPLPPHPLFSAQAPASSPNSRTRQRQSHRHR